MIRHAQVTRRGVGRAVLAVAVAAVAASVVYFGGRALGLGGDAPVVSQGQAASVHDQHAGDLRDGAGGRGLRVNRGLRRGRQMGSSRHVRAVLPAR